MAEYTYGKDFAIRTETDCIATENDFGQYVGRITAVKIKTNADRIRSMTDEELAEMLFRYMTCRFCPCNPCVTSENIDEEGNIKLKGCENVLLEWLKKEVEDG